MVQEQIVDYINAQMKLGVTRDAIKSTLTGAGWQVADVEDTLKKIESAKIAQPATSMAGAPVTATTSRLVTPVGASSSNSEPQTIKVSDLISASPATPSSTTAMPATTPARSSGPKSPLTGPPVLKTSPPAGASAPTSFKATSYPGMKTHTSRAALITEIILAVIIIAVGAFAGFLYMQNSTLKGQLDTLNGQSSGVNSQLSALQAQVTASTTALTAQVATLTTETQELQAELSFYAAPPNAAPDATGTLSFSGVVSGGGKAPYAITATYGGKIYVANSKVASVITALTPLLGTASTTAPAAQFSGTYTPGSDTMVLAVVNGTPLQ
jgi:hypothetical protein